jgi:hypothetical protein
MVMIDVVLVPAGISAAPYGTLQTAVMYPGEHITAILYWSIQQIDLRAQAVVRGQHDPATAQAVLDLISVDHFRRAEHPGAAMDVDYCQNVSVQVLPELHRRWSGAPTHWAFGTGRSILRGQVDVNIYLLVLQLFVDSSE